ncbi:ABC transporter permease [Arsukibacterium sp. MJ3]|jgi:ABC-2 type transport system permease protein|uniref:ABC transporter permease n=1 Tax=Arsukibacterium sp. MJ3 TaxID=1632859 RepID=UPI0006272BC7|nr:ABC transporter permease [Arsukibacterium sp. MJ3]KKO49454.1 ABC transporter permease [Arsukibacterium sp. MJ3]
MNTVRIYQKEAWYDLLSVWRTPGFVLPSLAFPVVFYLFFGVIFNRSGGSNTAAYMLVTYSCFGIMGPAMFNFAMNIASDRAHGWLTLKRLSPMPVAAYLLAKMSTSLVFALLIMLLLFSTAVLFGDVRLAYSQWLLLLLLLLVGTLPFALIGLMLGLTLSDKTAPGVVNLLYLPMAFLSGLWLPISMFPPFLQQLGWVWPSYHLSQIGLKVINMDQGHALWVHLLILTITSALLAGLALWSFKQLTAEKA